MITYRHGKVDAKFLHDFGLVSNDDSFLGHCIHNLTKRVQGMVSKLFDYASTWLFAHA